MPEQRETKKRKSRLRKSPPCWATLLTACKFLPTHTHARPCPRCNNAEVGLDCLFNTDHPWDPCSLKS